MTNKMRYSRTERWAFYRTGELIGCIYHRIRQKDRRHEKDLVLVTEEKEN